MLSNQSRLPCPELRPYVRAYVQRQIMGPSIDVVQPMPASLETIIDLEFGNPPIVEHLKAPCWKPFALRLLDRARIAGFGIDCVAPWIPSAFSSNLWVRQLFGIPGRLLVNHEYTAVDVIGKSIFEVRERMAETRCFDARVRIMEGHLVAAAAKASACTVIMASARRIFREQGALRVSELADQTSLSVRQYERRFLDEVGIAPKLFARITRYQMAMDTKAATPVRSWLTIAHEFGYHDQMHMIKDFQMFSGDSPCGILSQLVDMRPEALAASTSTL